MTGFSAWSQRTWVLTWTDSVLCDLGLSIDLSGLQFLHIYKMGIKTAPTSEDCCRDETIIHISKHPMNRHLCDYLGHKPHWRIGSPEGPLCPAPETNGQTLGQLDHGKSV